MLPSSLDDAVLLSVYRSLSPEKRAIVDAWIEKELGQVAVVSNQLEQQVADFVPLTRPGDFQET